MISWSLETPLKQPANVFALTFFFVTLSQAFFVFPWAMPRVMMLPSHWCLYLSKSKLKSGPAIWSRVRKRERSALPRKLFPLPASRKRKHRSRMILSSLPVQNFFFCLFISLHKWKIYFHTFIVFWSLAFVDPLTSPRYRPPTTAFSCQFVCHLFKDLHSSHSIHRMFFLIKLVPKVLFLSR